MKSTTSLGAALACFTLLLAGCSKPSAPAGQAPAANAPGEQPAATETQATTPPPAPETATADAATPAPEVAAAAAESTPAQPVAETEPAAVPAAATPAPAPAVTEPVRPAKSPPPAAVVAASPRAPDAPKPAAAPAPVAAPVAATATLVDPGGPVAVAATKTGLERVGSDTCGDCHDVQYNSWAESKHAARKPPLDCEDCHGPGSEYKSKTVMKDPAKAKAAGLVLPDKAFCSQCHKKGVDDAFLKKAHAHEEG